MTLWCARVLGADGVLQQRVRVTVDAAGSVASVQEGVDPVGGDLRLGTVLPGAGNAHSHAFHRALRGRTHGDGGDFWQWRDAMYEVAGALTPESYHALARAVFAEMLTSGYTAVGEFHYVHHRPDGRPYPFEMEDAIHAAAADTGIRLRLLDTAYLQGGIGLELSAAQRRFGDGSAEGYLERWHALRERLPSLGAAIHSVRAVPPDAIAAIAAGLPADVPLHVHVSEQPRENADALAAYGRTPTRVLADAGALTSRSSAVHATHLTDEDIRLLGAAEASIVMCPTTEADLGDGIGPAGRLQDAGAVLALGSDQNAVIDPFAEMRGLEMHERLASQRRGRFAPQELVRAATAGGYRSLGWVVPPLQPGGPCDLIEIDLESARTVGSDPLQVALTATRADVKRVVVGGRVVAENGLLASGEDPATLLRDALGALG